MPRLGCLSASLLSMLTFVGIARYGSFFPVSRILEEREKYRLITDGMEALLGLKDEDAIYQRICDHARQVSDSMVAAIVFFMEGNRSCEVRTVSLHGLSPQDLAASGLPLQPGAVYDIARLPFIKRQGDTRLMLETGSLAEFSAAPLAGSGPLSSIEQVLSYPVVLEGAVHGALVLLRDRGEQAPELFRVFAAECSLVRRYAWQIAELEKVRRLEEQLHRAQKMEAIGQLAGGIAHDFNNTLSGITGYAQLIRRKLGTSEPELAGYAEAMINAARHSADLTEKLLAFARRGTLQPIPLDMHQVIRESLQILEPTIGTRIVLRTALDAVQANVMGDPVALQNVIINLAINARNAMPSGGEIIIRSEIAHFDTPRLIDNEYEIRPGTWLVVHVSDTGIGIARQTRHRIFEPFFTTDTTGKGTGLGLSMVYGTVKSHSGFIAVQSEPGRGAIFSLYFPLLRIESEPAAAPATPKRKTEQVMRGHGHILVVDDDELIRTLARELLAFLGYTATTVESGVAAVEWAKEHPEAAIDAALIDIMMPRLDGYETYHQLRKLRPGLKAVFTTGYSLPRDTRFIANVNLCGFIQKPFESGKLSQVLYDIMHRENRSNTPAK